jgi:TRAP-type C4-dicarboxylate transport system permease small subunit
MIVDVIKKSRIALCRVLEGVLILAVFVLVIDVLWGVFTRFIMEAQADWTEELARFLLIWISLLGGAVAFGEKAHLGVDYFVGLFDTSAQKFLAVFAQLVVLFFAISIFVIGGTTVVVDTLQMQQLTPALGLQQGYVYLALPIAGAFIIIFTVERLLELLLTKDDGGTC